VVRSGLFICYPRAWLDRPTAGKREGGESEPWCQTQPIDRSNRDHGEEERDLREQQPTVVSAEQSGRAAGQYPAVDDAGCDERADADHAER
jgi:hypothetical protein